ncbi:MAG: LbtU family siderophore porin [Proteobacteria bacterium]|nr:LbtU family siderophore porin [Pseudomonadota bacterium]MBU1715334.1 LbtU family siderophore porin [Pseudomonadota bacterium]
MVKKFSKLLMFSCIGLMSVSVAQASDIDSRGELQNLRQRLERLEGQGAAEVSEEGEEETLFTIFTEDKTLSFWGELVINAFHSETDGEDSSSDLVVDTAALGADIQLSDKVGGHIVFLDEEGEAGEFDFGVDEANIVLRPWEVAGGGVSFVLGKAYLPFGQFNSSMITDPLTLELGETNNTIAMVGWANDLLEVNLGVFNGETDLDGSRDFIDSSFASLRVTPMEMISVGVSYISDLAESDGELVDSNIAGTYTSTVPGFAAFISLEVGPVTIDLEHVTALEEFDQDVVGADDMDVLSGKKPSASNVEVAFSPIDQLDLAVRYEKATDYEEDVTRYGITVSYSIFGNAVIALEYLAESPDEGSDDTQTVTSQLAFEF